MGRKCKKSVPTTAIKRLKKSTAQMVREMSFTVSIDPLNCRKFTTSEIGRGCGVQKPKKGKGSYARKGKYGKDVQPYG